MRRQMPAKDEVIMVRRRFFELLAAEDRRRKKLISIHTEAFGAVF